MARQMFASRLLDAGTRTQNGKQLFQLLSVPICSKKSIVIRLYFYQSAKPFGERQLVGKDIIIDDYAVLYLHDALSQLLIPDGHPMGSYSPERHPQKYKNMVQDKSPFHQQPALGFQAGRFRRRLDLLSVTAQGLYLQVTGLHGAHLPLLLR